VHKASEEVSAAECIGRKVLVNGASDGNGSSCDVKFMTVKQLLVFWRTNHEKINQSIQAGIQTLCNDPDAGIKYFTCGVQLKCQETPF
jgi:hypothetical protein